MRETDRALAHTYRGIPFDMRSARHTDVLAYLAEHARDRGTHPFISAVARDGGTRRLSYAEADDLSHRLAGWLRESLGIAPGSAVALAPANDAISVLATLALLRAGYRTLLINPSDPPARAAQQMSTIGAEVLLAAPATEMSARATEIPEPSGLSRPASAVDRKPDPGDDALYFGTSGSTAASKLVAQSHRNVVSNGEGVRSLHGMRPGERIIGCLPICHVNGMHFTVLGTVISGAHAVLAHSFDVFRYPKLIDEYRPRVASVVPNILDALAEFWRGPHHTPDLRYFVTAAAPLSATTAQRILERTGHRVVQAYGLSETTNFSTTVPALSEPAYRRIMLESEIPPVGAAFPGNEVAVLRPDGSVAAHDEQGEICMRGHNVMDRYANNDEATAAAFAGGWFHSQDLGFTTVEPETGATLFTITGRLKNQAKVGGESVSLDELDRALRNVPGVRDAACAALPDELLGETVAAVVDADGNLADTDILETLRAVLPEFALPRRLVRTSPVPRTSTGKVRRPEIAHLVSDVGGAG
ncbi:class I adenylate-forming enzyme family protein [Saccharopolyspora sp. SCSIO 74807]|uniref:class I adenylate-forming enzyme family protein n=1 Tax=Saccharopolyspora sp. SCSIO 74807 TaxID=3118084 RepID=UPI0030D3BBFA